MERPWAFYRRIQYGTGFLVFFVGVCALVYMQYFYTTPTCFDNRQNGDERGVDCGGSCTRICTFEVRAPEVAWVRSFRVVEGQYNAVAYVENKNPTSAAPEIAYTFSLYDEAGLITQRSGTTILPPNSVYPIFEARIDTAGRVPTQTFLELEDADVWLPAEVGAEQFTLRSRTLYNADAAPRLEAVLYNNAITEAGEVEVVATIFDQNGNALTASRTFIDNFAPRTEEQVVFTWPEPIAKTVRSCEVPTDVLLAVDVSGSMNNDQADPPQPLTAVLSAAQAFVNRLQEGDQAGLVTFASESEIVQTLTQTLDTVATNISSLSIDPSEETGSTNTGDAFVRATEEFASARHSTEARKVLVLLTDGLATAPANEPDVYAKTQAQTAKDAGIHIYTIGLGEQVNMDFVRDLASTPDQAHQALSANDIDRIYQTVTADLCEDGAAVIHIVAKSDASFETP